MKKLTIIILSIFILIPVFATEPVIKYDSVDFTFSPTSARFNGMGQSGISNASRLDSMFKNPALLSENGFAVEIPSVGVTVYNIKNYLSDTGIRDDFDSIIKKNSDSQTYVDLLKRTVSYLGDGYNRILSAEIGIAAKMGHTGNATTIQGILHSISNGESTLTNVTIVPEINLAETFAFGFRILDKENCSLSLGASAHFVYKAYYKGQGANTISGMITDSEKEIEETLFWDTPVMAGWGLPIDAGLSLETGVLTFSTTCTNLNGLYHMKSYASLGDLVQSLGYDIEQPSDHRESESGEFEIVAPYKINIGVTLTPEMKVLHPVVSIDLVDIEGLYNEIKHKTFETKDILLHMNAGAELSLSGILSVRAGLNQGYMSVGAEAGIPGIRVDASYIWREFGKQIGDKPVDALTIKVSIGYDK